MSLGKTPKDKKDSEIRVTKMIKDGFGEDFVAKLKSNRRYSFRDWRKEMGQGSASLRRYTKSKAIKSKQK